MAKTTAPLLSFGASGQIAKTMVMSSWKGRPYARRYTIPSNPKTDDQSLTRDLFAWLNRVWKTAPIEFTTPWDAAAKGQVLTGRNLVTKQNIPLLRGTLAIPVVDIEDMIFSPGARAGLALVSAEATPGNDQVSVQCVAPDLPTGWTVEKAIAVVIRAQDPHTGILYTMTAGTEVDPADPIVITGLASAVNYVSGAWLEYMRPDGQLAYGPSVVDTFLTT